ATEHPEALRAARQQEGGEQPTLGRAVAPDTDAIGGDRGDVVGELGLQEGLGLRALGIDTAPMRQHGGAAGDDSVEVGVEGVRGSLVGHRRYYRKSPNSSNRMKRLLLALLVVVAAVAATTGWLWHQYGH